MPLVAGIDSSTQSVKVVVCDAESGLVVRGGRSPHPDGTECEPETWWDALAAASAGLLEGVEALAVAGQQHGMVVLDDDGQVVRPALLWNDTARHLTPPTWSTSLAAHSHGPMPSAASRSRRSPSPNCGGWRAPNPTTRPGSRG